MDNTEASMDLNIELLDFLLVFFILTGQAKIMGMTFNRQTGHFTVNVGSDLFVWHHASETPPPTANNSNVPPPGGRQTNP